VQWRPYDLHPEYPAEGISRTELVRRYGNEFDQRLHAMFDEAGLPYRTDLEKVPNSRRALMLGELGRDRGLLEPLHARLFDAYWARGRDLGESSVLIEEGAAVGLEAPEVEAALENGEYLERIAHQTEMVNGMGAGGVPAFAVDRRVLIPGAQPHEVFERVLERLGHPPLDG
jgi:predicted DsbA family dithiol-disulfide isomerase